MIHDNPAQNPQQDTTELNDGRLRVGAVGWDHAHWLETYYPHDLPVEWRLGFYANEFPAVLVPQNQWREQWQQLADWAEDVPDEFRFYLQGETSDTQQQLYIQQQLGSRFAGMVSATQTDIALIHYNERSLREWREWLEQKGPQLQAIFLCDSTLSIKQLSDFKSLVELMGF
jgi:uncharacterized protein YecE (DUF72 family)